MITALDVANTLLERAHKENIDMNCMKLQRLIYIFYKTYLKQTNTKLFVEPFDVWKYGPVLQTVYYAFSKHGSNRITDFHPSSGKTYRTVKLENKSDFLAVFDNVWKVYSKFSATYLSQLTTNHNTAWDKANQKNIPILLDMDIANEKDFSCY